MSKYIKLEGALKAVRDNTMPLDCWHIDRMRAIVDLPTIEVSEDCISREWIDNAPNVVPGRAEGEWVEYRGLWKCSFCSETENRATRYCPNCGAKMKKGTVSK